MRDGHENLKRGLIAASATQLVCCGRSGLLRAGAASVMLDHLMEPIVIRKPGEKCSALSGHQNLWDRERSDLTIVDDTIDSGRTIWRMVLACAEDDNNYGFRPKYINSIVLTGSSYPEMRTKLFRWIPTLDLIYGFGEVHLRGELVPFRTNVPNHGANPHQWDEVPW